MMYTVGMLHLKALSLRWLAVWHAWFYYYHTFEDSSVTIDYGDTLITLLDTWWMSADPESRIDAIEDYLRTQCTYTQGYYHAGHRFYAETIFGIEPITFQLDILDLTEHAPVQLPKVAKSSNACYYDVSGIVTIDYIEVDPDAHIAQTATYQIRPAHITVVNDLTTHWLTPTTYHRLPFLPNIPHFYPLPIEKLEQYLTLYMKE